METSQCTIQLEVHNSPSVSMSSFHTALSKLSSAPPQSGGEIKPIITANYNSLEMRDTDNSSEQLNKTYVSRLDVPVEGGADTGLQEYVSTFHLPLSHTETNNNSSHKVSAQNVTTTHLQTGLTDSNSNPHQEGDNCVEGNLKTLDISRCSCCSEEVFVDQSENKYSTEYLSGHKGTVVPTIRYLDENSKENMSLYSFSTKSEWDVRSPPLTEWSSSQAQLDNTKDKYLSRSSQNILLTQDRGVNKPNRNASQTKGTDERALYKGSDNLHITSRLKPLTVKGATTDNKVIDQVRSDIHLKSKEESVETYKESPNGYGIKMVMESYTGYNNQGRTQTSDRGLSSTNVIKKDPPSNIIKSCAKPNSHDNSKARVPEYHSTKFKLEVTKAPAKPPRLTKHLSLPPMEGELLLSDIKSTPKSRVLHVPLATNVLIPIVLEEASPPKTIPTESRKNSATDLEELKEMATKLNLSTRRPSYLLWKERLHHYELSVSEMESQDIDSQGINQQHNPERQLKPLSGRVEAVNQALAWLRRELGEMRAQDQALARTLLQIRQDIKELKLQRLCAEHQELLEDARDLEEEKDIMGELSCEYIQESFSPTLKQVGVTRMNIGSRRFSVF